MDARRLLTAPWPLRAAWLGLPIVVGPALADALDGASHGVQGVASIGLWTGWAAGLLATFVPRAATLTVIRVLAPAAVVATAAAARPPSRAVEIAALAWALVTAVAAFAAATTDAFVDGSSYGPERRFALRIPGPLLAGPVEATWAVAVSGVATGPLLLGARLWLAGAIAAPLGWAAAALAFRSLHGLSRRWIVLVPAGLVIHDPMTLADPVLLRRSTVTYLGPASDPSDAVDLSGRAPGLAIEVRVEAPVQLPVRRRRDVVPAEAEAIFVTPVRPASLLAAAGSRRLPVP